MNREIKFRAWDIRTNKMFSEFEIGAGNGFSFFEGEKMYYWKLMQFTGIIDRKLNKVYEGDICDGHSDGYGIIVWTDFDGGYDYQFVKEPDSSVPLWEVKNELVVIGNIYENPELIKL